MNSQLLTNCDVFDGEQLLANHSVLLNGDLIESISDSDRRHVHGAKPVDLGGGLLAPGFIDLQVNGGGGVNFNDAPNIETLQTIASAHRRCGTTGFLPTLISDDPDTMRQAIDAVDCAVREEVPGILGIHLEGPHLNPEYRGVHSAAQFRPLDSEALELLCSLDVGHTLVTLAPEMVPADQIRKLNDAGVIVFAGHTGATFDELQPALSAGLRGFTHLYNAMTPLTGREPGAVGAALHDSQCYVGIIADGSHVHRASIATAIRAKGAGRTLLVSDAMAPVGKPDAGFQLGDQTIRTKNGRCVTPDGRLAGSAIGLIDAVRHVTENEIVSKETALMMAASNPATCIGIDNQRGFVKAGYRADLILLDDQLNIIKCWIGGHAEDLH